MKEKDIYWQVVWVNRADEYEEVEALCGSEDEALKVKEELTKKRRYNDSFDYYRLDNHWVYEVRQATGAELEAERQRRINQRMAKVQKSFWQYMDGEDFVEITFWLDGSDAAPVLEKEIYYPYLVNDNWMIYQDDADDESLHLRHVRSGEDITLCPTPTYSPVIFGTDLYCVTSANGDKTLAKIDMTYTPDSPGNFAIEYGEVPESADITISASGYLYYGSENGLYIDRWREATNPEAKFQLAYHYIGEDYEIYWQYNDEGQVTALYVTLIASGGSNSLPRFD